MSGGHFDYSQHKIRDIYESIEDEIRKSGKPKTKEELNGFFDDWYDKYPEDKIHYKYPDEIIEKFKEAVYFLKKAYVYAHRVDYLLSQDDGEESFLERLEEELKKVEEGKSDL